MGRFFSSSLLAAAATSLATAHETPNTVPDYVIVGAGPAGLVLAEQLSRNSQTHVVLIEAGPDSINDQAVNIPAEYPFITEQYWNFTSLPDPNLNGTTVSIQQGRSLGGGTAVNGMAYCRGAASLFDEWATLSGNPGLAWDSLFQDFLEVSSYQDPPDANYPQVVNKSGYGNGPLEVSRSSGLTGFEFPFANALESELGLPEVDLTDGTGIGVDLGIASIFAVNRTRSYARTAFGKQIDVRSNVQVITNAWVSKINFSGTTAQSVTYHTPDGKVTTVKGKEFIISGGAINTPKLLMLSGVGPKAQLSALKIPVVADIPDVGANLRDHAFAILEVEVTSDILTVFQIFLNSTEEVIAQEQYAANASGPLGWNNGFVYAGFRLPDSVWDGVNGTHYTTLPSDRPHALLEFSTAAFINVNVSALSAWSSLVQPESSGFVSLNTTDFRDDPLIYTNFYSTDADKAAIMASYKTLRSVFQVDSVKEKTVAELFPGPDVTTDEQIWETIQKQTFSFHHPVGTVALGKALDSNWRLMGLKGIRVVDSSTFPYPTTCHPQGVIYALANRAAKDILQADKAPQHN